MGRNLFDGPYASYSRQARPEVARPPGRAGGFDRCISHASQPESQSQRLEPKPNPEPEPEPEPDRQSQRREPKPSPNGRSRRGRPPPAITNQVRVFPSSWYAAAIVVDLLARLSWAIYISPGQQARYASVAPNTGSSH